MKQMLIIFASLVALVACGTREDSRVANIKSAFADVTCLTQAEFTGDPHAIIRGSKLVIKGDFKDAKLSDYRARELSLTSPSDLFGNQFRLKSESFTLDVKDFAHSGTLYRDGVKAGTFSVNGPHGLILSVDDQRLIMTCDNK